VVGAFKLQDGNQGANKILTCDANGLGTWQAPSVIEPAANTDLDLQTAPGTGDVNIVTNGGVTGGDVNITSNGAASAVTITSNGSNGVVVTSTGSGPVDIISDSGGVTLTTTGAGSIELNSNTTLNLTSVGNIILTGALIDATAVTSGIDTTKIKLSAGTPALGNVLTSDAFGEGSWQPPTTAGNGTIIVSQGGTFVQNGTNPVITGVGTPYGMVALGDVNTKFDVTSYYSVVIGAYCVLEAAVEDSVCIGNYSTIKSGSLRSIVIGTGCFVNSNSNNCIAQGYYSRVFSNSEKSIVIGGNSMVEQNSPFGTMVGYYTQIFENTLAPGLNGNASCVCIGYRAQVGQTYCNGAISIGSNTSVGLTVASLNSIVIGKSTTCDGNRSTVIGAGSVVNTVNDAILIGNGSTMGNVATNGNIMIGNSLINNTHSTCVSLGVEPNASDQFGLRVNKKTTGATPSASFTDYLEIRLADNSTYKIPLF